MTYSINVRPYNNPYIKIAEEAIDAAIKLLIAVSMELRSQASGDYFDPSFLTEA